MSLQTISAADAHLAEGQFLEYNNNSNNDNSGARGIVVG
jgi:hypothetical protein